MELNQNFPHIINSSFLTYCVDKSRYLSRDRFVKKFNNWQIGGEFKKESKHNVFLIHVK